jgi:sigma-B regulation protein RsbU (phosphoserine phosphatase)
MALLVVLNGTNQGACIPLSRERTLVGRSAYCDVYINLPSASREHACITRSAGQYYLEDLGSRNGTFLDNDRVRTRVPLQEGQQLKICDCLFSFFEKMPATPPAGLGEDCSATSMAIAFPVVVADSDADPEDSSTIEASVKPSQLPLEAQSAGRLKTLLDISSRLSRTLDFDHLLHTLIERLFELFKQAERGFVVLVDEGSGRLVTALTKTRWTEDEATAHFNRAVVRQCLETTQGLLSEEAVTGERRAPGRTPRDVRIRSVLCAPLCAADGRTIGVLQLDTPQRGRRFNEDDLALLVCVAGQAAAALENARLHQESMTRERLYRDMSMARQMQLGFLPRALPAVPGYEFYTHYEPALEVSGDYYDFIPLPGNRLAIALGDVAGKGIPAALLMAKLSAETRFCLLTEPDLPTAVSRISELLAEQISRMDGFVTLVVGILDPAAHRLCLVSAGHIPPLLTRPASGDVSAVMPTDVIGLPLGVMAGIYGTAHWITLAPGDQIVAFTDGVTDAMDAEGRLFRVHGIRAALMSGASNVSEAGKRVLGALRQHAAGQKPVDNITLVCVGRCRV